MTDRWAKPHAITDAELVFPARVAHLMPAMSDIPAEFKVGFSQPGSWSQFQSDWFFRGLRGSAWEPRPGVDLTSAQRHLAAIQGSFEPKHEHKAAAVAYLASLWFVRVTVNDTVYGEQVAA